MSKTTPTPYVVGQPLDLVVTRTFDKQIRGRQLPLTITKTFEVTQSPVMVVTFVTESGPMDAVLKLYDRRFGRNFRTIRGKYSPHSSDDEAAWHEYVRKGMADPFFRQLEEEEAASLLPLNPAHKHNDTSEGHAQYEGALQRQAMAYFDTETRTYEKLTDLQGAYIPTMLAHVCVSQPRLDLQTPEMELYFRIPGILIQRIDSCASLWELAESQTPFGEQKLGDIVQMAVDEAVAVNNRGVVMNDCRPENVIIEQNTCQPFIHDFAQCFFEEACVEDPDDPDAPDYRACVIQSGNPRAIGMVMEMLVRRKLGYQLSINYRA